MNDAANEYRERYGKRLMWSEQEKLDYLDAITVRDSAHNIQIGGDHYKGMKIQPYVFITENGLGWLEGNAIKYICRHNVKGGVSDIDKAIHYLQLLREQDYEQE